MPKQVEFGEKDFEAIEYRNEYRHTKAVFACRAAARTVSENAGDIKGPERRGAAQTTLIV
jgi:hypothetical protein